MGKTDSCFLFHHYSSSSVACLFILSIDKNDPIQFDRLNGYSQNSNFVGLDNYKTVLTNPNYFSVFKTSLYYFIATFFQLGIALLFATILSFKVKFANF